MQPLDVASILAEATRALDDGSLQRVSDAERLERECEAKARQHERAREYERRVREQLVEPLPITDEDRAAIVADALEDTHALRLVRRWLEARPSPWLVLLGGTGTGKTVAAAWAIAHAHGAYISATQLRALMTRAVWDGDDLPDAARSRLLVLDDLGAEKETDPEKFQAALFELLNRRQSERTRTIITSNLSRSRLADRTRYGDRVVDRINHLAHVVELSGATLRRKTGSL